MKLTCESDNDNDGDQDDNDNSGNDKKNSDNDNNNNNKVHSPTTSNRVRSSSDAASAFLRTVKRLKLFSAPRNTSSLRTLIAVI